jgi:hypothetical protein
MNKVIGRRIYPNEEGQLLFSEGDYGYNEKARFWEARPPNSHTGGLKNHTVIEHEDGTITVSPSILITNNRASGYEVWHGYLERGIWREV